MTRALREPGPGDQPMPTKNEHTPTSEYIYKDLQEWNAPEVEADLRARVELGVSRYGVALQPFNGRNTLVDLYQETLDAAHYARTLLLEKDHRVPWLETFYLQLLRSCIVMRRQIKDEDLQVPGTTST